MLSFPSSEMFFSLSRNPLRKRDAQLSIWACKWYSFPASAWNFLTYGWRNKLVNTSLNHRILLKIHQQHAESHEITQKPRKIDLTLRIAIFFDGDLDFHGFNTSNLLKMKKKLKNQFLWGRPLLYSFNRRCSQWSPRVSKSPQGSPRVPTVSQGPPKGSQRVPKGSHGSWRVPKG